MAIVLLPCVPQKDLAGRHVLILLLNIAQVRQLFILFIWQLAQHFMYSFSEDIMIIKGK